MTDTKKKTAGKVWLVGAGPGDPGLITVKGLQCLTEADVVVYDYLSNPALLAHARPAAEIIYVGKIAGNHAMKQEDINQLLANKALEGKRVCRLKGGDPFVFGRGGEEAETLHDHGIAFEVVPGVTSAVAVPAYAGIPVTHRAFNTSLRLITGHEDPTKTESSLDWKEIGATSGTLVFFMSIRNVPNIAENLIANGRAADTPVAIISNGTLPNQRTVTGTLANIAAVMEREAVKPPGLFVVGEVVTLREKLGWFENRPLFGRSIAVTRSRTQASSLVSSLEALGAEAISAPTIRIESLSHTPEMRQAARELNGVDWLIFTSANGVDSFFDALEQEGRDVRALAGRRVAAIGPATGDQLKAKGLRPDLMPARFVAEALLEAFDAAQEPVKGKVFLLPRADIAREALADGLRERGATVIEVHAYRTVHEDTFPQELLDRIERDEIDLVTFSSSSTVHNFVAAAPEARREAILKHVRAASIGPVTSATLKEYGIPITVDSEVSTIPGLTEAIIAYFTS